VQITRKKYKRVKSQDINQVVSMYMAGSSMKDVAESVGLSKTTVFEILHSSDTPDCPIFQCHNLAINLRKYRLNTKQYIDLIRARNILNQQGIDPHVAISEVRDVVEMCYSQDLHLQTLATSFSNFRNFVSSVNSDSPEHLKLILDESFNAWESLANEIDNSVKNCVSLTSQIDILEKLLARSSRSISK
jgi:YesN/AraC family two-component response regulator